MTILFGSTYCNERIALAATAELVGLVYLVDLVLLVSLVQPTKQTRQTIQTRKTYCSLGCLLLDRRPITTKVRMVKPKSQRLGQP